MARVDARASIDGWTPEWGSFAEFFFSRSDDQSDFLTELDHGSNSRLTWTAGEWRHRVLATTHWLRSRGVREGDSVATLAGNTADALAVAYATWVLGACCVPLNPGDGVDRQSYIVQDAAAKLLIYRDGSAALISALEAGSGIELVSTDDMRSAVADVLEPTRVAGARLGLNAPALRVYTSGTTGQPKGVVLTARNLLTDSDALQQGLEWPSDTRIITVLPVHHVNGLVISSLLPWYAQYSTVLCDRFRSELFWEDVERESATVCSMVPSLLEFLLNSAGTAPAAFREVVSGAGPLLTDTAEEFEDRFGVPVRHLYGLSETTAVVTLTPRMEADERRKWHHKYGSPSIGQALPHAEVTVHRPDGQPAGAGERGEIVIRGDVVMEGYAGLPDVTKETLRDGWFHSGDEGFWVEEPGRPPFFFITGRLKELIIRGGSNISPLEVDAVLRSHPAVEFGLTIPFENRFYGEEIAAYVVPASPVSDEDILAHCARYLDFARQPKIVIQGKDVPFTATGKAKRLELKRRLEPALSQYRDTQFRRSSPTSNPTRAVSPAVSRREEEEIASTNERNEA